MSDTADPTGSVQRAIANVIRDLPGIGKDATAAAAMGGYRYRGIEAITRVLQPLLARHGLVIVPQAQEMETVVALANNNKQMQDTRIRFQWLIVGPDGTTLTASTWGIGRDHTDKGGNKAQTQAYKYLLMHLFCIADPADDGDGHDYTRDAADRPSPMAGPDPVRETFDRVKAWKGKPEAETLKAFAAEHEMPLTEKALAEDGNWHDVLLAKLDALDVAAEQDAVTEPTDAPPDHDYT